MMAFRQIIHVFIQYQFMRTFGHIIQFLYNISRFNVSYTIPLLMFLYVQTCRCLVFMIIRRTQIQENEM